MAIIRGLCRAVGLLFKVLSFVVIAVVGVDIVLTMLHEFGWDDGRVAEETGVAVLDVQKIRGMVQRSRHKRGLGMIPKIGIRTVGLDLREDPCW